VTVTAAASTAAIRRATTGPSLDPRTVIHVDDVHPAVRPPSAETVAELFPLTPDACDLAVVLFKLPPNYVGTRHSHDADTVYIVRRGVFEVEGEGRYEVGDIRWVKAGTVYGPEKAGPEGADVYLIAAGTFPLATNRAD
jgi:quercetin dioxygenase-like cupin family protein